MILLVGLAIGSCLTAAVCHWHRRADDQPSNVVNISRLAAPRPLRNPRSHRRPNGTARVWLEDRGLR